MCWLRELHHVFSLVFIGNSPFRRYTWVGILSLPKPGKSSRFGEQTWHWTQPKQTAVSGKCLPWMCDYTTVGLKIAKFNGIKVFGPSRCPVYTRLLWMGPNSQVCANKISSSVRWCFNSVVVQNIFSTRRAFPSVHKDVLPTYQQSLVIYQYKCQCEADFVGKTIQQLEVRIAQHVTGQIQSYGHITDMRL